MSVVIPSYRRPHRLLECLDGLACSAQQPDQVIVVLRTHDHESHRAIRGGPGKCQIVHVAGPGQHAALLAGATRARGDVIAFLDDDAVPRPDWLTRIVAQLQRSDVGGVGGRDIVTDENGLPFVTQSGRLDGWLRGHRVTDQDGLPRVAEAGRLTRWGKLIGNHHLVIGPPREVDILKGANMAFRREALALPTNLLGHGAQVHNEVAICLWAKRHGWRLVLDPGAEVVHRLGERFDSDQRSNPSLWSTHRAAFNLTWSIFSLRPQLALPRLLYGVLVGDRGVPGISRAVIALLSGEYSVWMRLIPSVSGQLRAVALILCRRKVEMHTFTQPDSDRG